MNQRVVWMTYRSSCIQINDPLSMYSGDMMTVNVNLSGLPVSTAEIRRRVSGSRGFGFTVELKMSSFFFLDFSFLQAVVVRSGLVQADDAQLPVGLQFIGRPFGSVQSLSLHHCLARFHSKLFIVYRESDLLDIAHTFEICTWDALNSAWDFC